MSNRSVRKVRHYKQTPSFKERVHAGVAKQVKELWAKYGWGNMEPMISEETLLSEELAQLDQNEPGWDDNAKVAAAPTVLEAGIDSEAIRASHGPGCNHDH